MYRSLIVFIIAFAVSAISGPFIIKLLKKLKFGQKILEIGPVWHMKKQNATTMGGFIFIFGISAAMLASLLIFGTADCMRWVMVVAMAMAFGVIGFIDDWHKIKKSQNKGLGAKQKFFLQLAVAIIFMTLMRYMGLITQEIVIPFTKWTIELPWILYYVIIGILIVGIDNAVNLTDGIDGLATSVTFVVMAFFFAAAYYLSGVFANGEAMETAAMLPAATCGALGGFLIYNFNPAKVFMGDTGSLYLGGLVIGMALAIDLPLIIIPVGLIYLFETVSVMIQVTYFKMSGGKRVFKMAPIHHHFEMSGYSERQIVAVAFLITVVCCVLSYFGIVWLFPAG